MVAVEEAVGMVLCHDITQIIPGRFKGRAFQKGHIIAREDVPKLRDLGKEHIYVWDLSQGYLHEDSAALRMARAAAGDNLALSEPKEGKVELRSTCRGLLKVNEKLLFAINGIDEVMFATLHSNRDVTANRIVAGTRVIPLVVREEKILEIERLCRSEGPLVNVKEYSRIAAGIVTTGNEVYAGRIKDGFGQVIHDKLRAYGSRILRQIIVPDDAQRIADSILALIREGAQAVYITGGMSVDPDDVSPAGIRLAAEEVVSYGAPTLPGAMFMLAYRGDIPVLGLPGCVMYSSTSIFDLVLPRLLAGERLKRSDIIKYAAGGLCLNCEACRFPDCAFGKGN